MSAEGNDHRFPWRRTMQLGLGYLRLAPSEFWRMTPRELEAALTAAQAFEPPSIERSDLSHLMRLFPDDTHRPS
ncbi:MAG TPA: rcc01693 family protein [Aestuariivirgaceae bacterium]|jgi:uncharacterized phage protein (TIGR02216 family)